MMDLIELMIKAQKRRRLTDAKFSRLLGVDYSAWSRVKRRQRQPSAEFLSRVMVKTPELALPVIDYMREVGMK